MTNLLYPRVVTLGKTAPEPVDRDRDELHRWLVEQLTGEPTRVIPIGRTVYVRSTEFLDDDQAISRWLSHSGVDAVDDPSTLVIDLGVNDYDLLRDPLAQDAASFAAGWISGHPGRTSVILLPAFPAMNASLFWKPLRAAEAVDRIAVIANDGRSWIRGVDQRGTSDVGREYAERLAKLTDPEQTEVRKRILQELGHFPVVDGEDEYCARYFFDAGLIVNDIARTLADRIVGLALPADRLCLLTHGPNSDWLHVAGLLTGGRLPGRPPSINITELADLRSLAATDRICVPIFDVVNSGGTCRRVIRELIDAGVPLAGTVFTVMIDRQSSAALPAGYELSSLFEVVADKRRREDCEQCAYSLPPTPPLSRDHQCRPFDMWHVLLRHPWKPEAYGPDGVPRFPEAPDLGAIFERFGGWIGYKVAAMLADKVADRDVVFVCPEEVEVNKLMHCLSPRFHDKTVAVRIPRPVLDRVKAGADPTELTGGWRTQLEHVAGAPRRAVVVIDEFNASNTTARALMTVLRAYDVEPDLYAPVLNRAVDAEAVLSVEVRALYQIPSPRVPQTNGSRVS